MQQRLFDPVTTATHQLSVGCPTRHPSTKSMKEQHHVTRLILELLHKPKLFLWHEKCEFKKISIEYLRLIISEGKIHMNPVKVAGVMEWPTPTNRKEVQFFLSFTNFIIGSSKASPITQN